MIKLERIDGSNYDRYDPMLPNYIKLIVHDDEDAILVGIVGAGSAVGTIAVSVRSGYADILWYYIDPGFRGVGAGRESFFMFTAMLHDCFGVKLVNMDIPVDADESIYRLFNGLPAEFAELPECHFEISLGFFRSSSKFKGSSKRCVSLEKVDDTLIRDFCNKIVKAGDALVPMPIKKSDYWSEASAVYVEDNEVKGVLLLRREGDHLSIPYMVSHSKNGAAILDMILFAGQNTGRLSEETTVVMNLMDERLGSIVRAMAGLPQDDDEFFKHNTRVMLPLYYIDKNRADIERRELLWREAKDNSQNFNNI